MLPNPTRRRPRWLVLAPVVALVAVVAATSPAGSATAATVKAKQFAFSDAGQSWQVPEGVSTIHLHAVGGSGTDGASQKLMAGGRGGLGGTVDADVAVTPGETLYVITGAAATLSEPGAGYNPGGFGGADLYNRHRGNGGGSTGVFGGDSRVLAVAGGGGGGGGAWDTGAGGDAGPGGGNRGYAGHAALGGSGGSGSSGSNRGGDGDSEQAFIQLAAGGGGGGGWTAGGTGGGAGGHRGSVPLSAAPGGGGAGGQSYGADPAAAYGVAPQPGSGSVTVTWTEADPVFMIDVAGTVDPPASRVTLGTPVSMTVHLSAFGGYPLPPGMPGDIQFGTHDLVTGVDTPQVFAAPDTTSTFTWTVVLPAGVHVLYATYTGGGRVLPWKSDYYPVTVVVPVSSLSLTPASVDFGSHDVGTTTTKTVTALNTGNQPWTLASMAFSGADFRITGGTCGTTTLAPEAECTYELAFAPSQAGNAAATLTLTSTAGDSAAVQLAGVGTAPVVPPVGPPPAPSAPGVTGIAPGRGPRAGGTVVTITGTNLVNVTGIRFGTRAATSVSCPSPTTCTAVSPAGTGRVDVRVTTPAGTSPKVAADRFRYR